MTLETDLLLDRRRLKRRLFFWRVLALAAVVVATLAAIGPDRIAASPHIARVSVEGVISDDRARIDAITKLATDDSVRAVIVSIDSPGGSVGGGEALHNAFATIAAKKPLVAVMRGTAASAGYMAAMPAARIWARNSTITGSIGVLLQTGDVSGLLNSIGVTAETIVSGPLKDQPGYTHPLSDAGRAVLQDLVGDMYAQFVAIVAQGRGMTEEKVRSLADGRAYTGAQALKLGLIDAIGGEAEARAWLAEAKGIPLSLDVQNAPRRSFADRAMGDGLGSIMKVVLSQALKLDGMVSIWQPSISGR